MSTAGDTSDYINIGGKDLFELFQKGDETISASNPEDVVLVMGNTGAGKSTLTQFIAGDNDKLISVEVNEGSGEFVIVDKNGKISSNSTIVSHTFLPELIVDPETNVAFYDCPGFMDTRSATHDIAASYFVKRIIDSSKRVKIIFVVNYSSVRIGVDRNDFMLLLKHIIKMVKDIDKFKDSIALIVSKVDNKYMKKGNSMILVPDEKIMDSIANFLSSVKRDLKSQAQPNITHFHDNALKLVELFLKKDGGRYSNIGIFRRPDEPGPLGNISLLQSKKAYLKNIIHSNIHFVEKNNNDFGYSVSAESINYIHDLADKINLNISFELYLMGEQVVSHYVKKETMDHNIYSLINELKFGAEIFSNLRKQKITSPLALANQLISYLNKLSFNISNDSLRIVDYDRYLNFLRDVSNETLIEPLKWMEGLKSANEYMHNSWFWYDFLLNLYDSLSEYSIQRNAEHFNVENIIKKSITGPNVQVDITSLGLEDLINKISTISHAHNTKTLFDMIKDNYVNKSKLKYLKNILDLTLNDKKKITCISYDTFIIQGNYLKISDIIKQPCYESATSIAIMASTKVFFDDNIYKLGDKVQVSIFAPLWEVIGEKTIMLDGKSGKEQGKAKNGYYEGERGSDGEPGLPGGPGGNFIGVVTKITAGKLTISSNGGNGGQGQEGGDGADGRRGADAPYVSEQVTRTVFDEWGPEETWDYRGHSWSMLASDNRGIVGWYNYKAYGKRASRAGDGGDGGAGGKGGCPGNVVMHEISKSPNIVILNQRGEDGKPGGGGSGGDVAPNGYNLYVDCRADRYILVSATYCSNTRREFNGYGSFGTPGSNGVYRLGMKNVESSKQLNDVSTLFNVYKVFLDPYLNSSFLRPEQLKLYHELESAHNLVSTAAKASRFNKECSRRSRRQVTKYDNVAPLVRNSASTAKSSCILNFLYSSVLLLLKTSNPMNLINNILKLPKKLYGESDAGVLKPYEKTNFYHPIEEQINTFNNKNNKEYSISTQYYNNYSWRFIHSDNENDSAENSLFNTDSSLFSSPSNLMLWDLVLRRFSREKHNYSFDHYEPERSDFSHNLAYRHYLPH